jgi:hypothetical protein
VTLEVAHHGLRQKCGGFQSSDFRLKSLKSVSGVKGKSNPPEAGKFRSQKTEGRRQSRGDEWPNKWIFCLYHYSYCGYNISKIEIEEADIFLGVFNYEELGGWSVVVIRFCGHI